MHRGGTEQAIIRSNMLEEWIDIFKFWLCTGLVWGFTPEDFIQEFERKSAVVEQRFKQERQLDLLAPDTKIAGVDIDGVLADYPRSYIEFINSELGTNYDTSGVADYDIGKALGLPVELAMELKDKYRQTGQKRYIPVCEGAKQFLEWLKQQGYTIVLLTSRPYKKYKRIFADTQEWLAKNGLVYDVIIWDETKHERLLKEFGVDRVEFFVDDVAKYCNDIAEIGVRTFLVNRAYNQGSATHPYVDRVDKLSEVITKLEGRE